MYNHEKYLQKRGNIYYFVKKINGKVVKISLKSSNLEYCKILRNRIIESLKMENEKELINKILKKTKITKEEAEKIYTNDQLVEMDKQFQEIQEIEKGIDKEKYLEEVFAEDIAKDNEIKELKKDKNNQIYEIVNNLQAEIKQLKQPKKEENEEIEVSKKIIKNIDKYFEEFLKYKENIEKITDKKYYTGTLKYFKYFLKQKENIVLNFKFFKELQQQFKLLPSNFFKYKNLTELNYEEVVIKTKKYKKISDKTVNKHVINLKMFFEYLVYEEVIKENPLKNIRNLKEEASIEKLEFTADELNNIFNSDIEKIYKNMCKIALYTGLRIGEILSLKKVDIKDDFINVTLEDKSSKKHTRIIPIHKNIKEIIEYQKKNNIGNYLFFSGNTAREINRITKLANRRLQKIVNDKSKTFHSFRKNFSQEIELNTTAEEKTKKYLMGHTLNKDVTHVIYNKNKINEDKLRECIDQITFNY